MKTYKINRNLVIIEKPKLDCKASGWIIDGMSDIVIEIKEGLPETEKALVVIHELAHYVQHRMEENNTPPAREKTAERLEKWIKDIIVKYHPFLQGLIAIKEKNGKT